MGAPPPPSGILVPARGEGGTAAAATKPAVASGWDRLGCMAIFMREENSLRLGLGCRFSGVPIRPSSLAVVVGALIMGSMEDEEGTAHAALLLLPPTPVSPPKDDEETKESGAGKSPGAGSDMASSDG